MSNSTKNTTFYVGLGYALIFLVAISSSVIAYTLEKRIQQSTIQLSNHHIQKSLVENLYQAARDRSVMLLKMVTTDDPFEKDALQMTFFKQEQAIREAFATYQSLETTAEEQKLLQQLFEVTTLNRDLQNQVVELALNEQNHIALDTLVDITLPVQEQAIAMFQTLYATKNQLVQQAQQAVNQDIQAIKRLWVFTLVSLFVVLGLVSLISLKKLHRAQRIQDNFKNTLEDEVRERTKEIVLDSAILQNIHESIAITTEKGEIIKTNLKFSTLLAENDLEEEFYIWSLLNQLFVGINEEKLFADVVQQGYARQEGALRDEDDRHFLVDVYQIEDIRLDSVYLSFLFTDITHLKQTQNELETLANYDLVTQLPNRHLFQRTLKSWIKDEQINSFALFFLDLDNFKWVNDTQGHAAGDRALQQVAHLLQTHTSNKGINLVARLGGDEFAIICQQIDELELAKFANELIEAIKQQYQPVNPSQTLGCSVGIAIYPKDGLTQEDLMRHADFAMYKAKEQGKNGYCLFSNKMNEHIHYLYESEINLHQALKNNEFFLVYQPQYRLDTLQVVGAEALLRWKMADRLVPPDEFIPLAEKFGLIQALGGFVLDNALQQVQQWQQNNKHLQRIAINVSSAQLNGQGFPQLVKYKLEQYELLPEQLDLEITESLLMDHLHEDNSELYELQQKGLEISLDDFGTGYSSLAYIKHLNVDRIKIDRSFIRDLDYNAESYSIVAAIITMGKSLGLKVLAEGIETEHQLSLLRELGCDEGQGYLFSRPVTADEFPFDKLDILKSA